LEPGFLDYLYLSVPQRHRLHPADRFR